MTLDSLLSTRVGHTWCNGRQVCASECVHAWDCSREQNGSCICGALMLTCWSGNQRKKNPEWARRRALTADSFPIRAASINLVRSLNVP